MKEWLSLKLTRCISTFVFQEYLAVPPGQHWGPEWLSCDKPRNEHLMASPSSVCVCVCERERERGRGREREIKLSTALIFYLTSFTLWNTIFKTLPFEYLLVLKQYILRGWVQAKLNNHFQQIWYTCYSYSSNNKNQISTFINRMSAYIYSCRKFNYASISIRMPVLYECS